jgi:hypothetical protein
MIYRGPGRGHTGRMRKRDNLLTGEGGARSRIIRPQNILVLYKSFNTPCYFPSQLFVPSNWPDCFLSSMFPSVQCLQNQMCFAINCEYFPSTKHKNILSRPFSVKVQINIEFAYFQNILLKGLWDDLNFNKSSEIYKSWPKGWQKVCKFFRGPSNVV